MMESEDEMAARPAWQQLALTDARTGTSFTLADFAGRTVYVEPMATWCTKCREQLGYVRDTQAQLDPEKVVFVALSVETNVSAAELARYADEQGFPFTFAVMTPELLQELSATFGRTIANPPSTPHFIIRPDGSVTELSTGIKPAEEIRARISAAMEG
jgi:thiol-disulfide isomerase/thioredoxin